jgi:ubiquitin C-terminal hydrolase
MLKLNTNLRYDEVKKIDIEPYLAPNSILRESANFSSVYELYSVIQHVGSGNSGHYTVICKRKMRDSDDEVWVFFDDKYSRIMRES